MGEYKRLPPRWYADVLKRDDGSFQSVVKFYGGIGRSTLPTRSLRCRHHHLSALEARGCAIGRILFEADAGEA